MDDGCDDVRSSRAAATPEDEPDASAADKGTENGAHKGIVGELGKLHMIIETCKKLGLKGM